MEKVQVEEEREGKMKERRQESEGRSLSTQHKPPMEDASSYMTHACKHNSINGYFGIVGKQWAAVMKCQRS